jgi:hypothetical protein
MNRAWIVWVGLAAALTGCVGSQTEKVEGRSQIGEDPADPDAFATVGAKTTPANTEPIPVSGVGLVYRLAGTGSSAAPGGWRTMLENSLKKQGFSNLRELLDDPAKSTSLVLVSALIPPGARKGELIDVQISLPEDSRTTSLKGGMLLACDLYNYDTTGNLQSIVREGKPAGPRGDLKLGSVWARAEGPVVAGSYVPAGRTAPEAAEGEPPSLKAGRVWGGGRVTQHRPYYFLMNPGDQNARMAGEVAERLNATFNTGDPNLKIAEFKTRELILVHVPAAYRHAHYRYLVVARQVPIVPIAADSLYRRKLEDELLDPTTALRAAVKLEAAGGDNLRALRIAKENPSPWVRFAAAESLAYLGQTDGAAELARLAEDHPALRAQCLKALASMDDAAFTDRLVELMGNTDPVLRYGAFVALRLADENNPAVKGVLLNNSFWLHRVAAGSPGMVHLTGDRRSEIVLFGDGVALRGPVPPLPVGSDFTVSLPAGEAEAKVTRIVRAKNGDSDVKEMKCKPDLGEVVATIGRLGGGYSEAVEFLRRADSAQVLTAAVVIDAVPRQFTIQQLAAFAKSDPMLLKANQDVAKIGTVRPDVEQAGYNLPADQDPTAVATDPSAARAPLSRDPGRIFGPKRPPEPANAEGLTPVTPAAAPPAPEAAARAPGNPGTLVPRK